MTISENTFRQNHDHLVQSGILTEPGSGFSMLQDSTLFFMSSPETVGRMDVHQSAPAGTPSWLNSHQAVYQKATDVQVLIQSRLPYTVTAAMAGNDVPPLLDDFAQLVGVTARVVLTKPTGNTFPLQVIRGLKRRNAVLVPDWGGLCAAGTFDDAVAVAQVLEKGCRALVDSAFLGGGHKINWVESWLMRLVYRYKYSRTATPS
jgi:ribulose-5-phosphate 4-epimerase/fuculose-1-phosphate aldolase